MSDKISKTELSKIENQKWDDLYQYIRKEIMNYPMTQPLSKHFVLRLKGLRKGKFIANNKSNSLGEYDFEIILLTFKINKLNILNGMNRTEFNNEQHKINYIMTIIENKINDTVAMLEAKKKTDEKIENLEIVANENVAKYKKKTKKISKNLKDLL